MAESFDKKYQLDPLHFGKSANEMSISLAKIDILCKFIPRKILDLSKKLSLNSYEELK